MRRLILTGVCLLVFTGLTLAIAQEGTSEAPQARKIFKYPPETDSLTAAQREDLHHRYSAAWHSALRDYQQSTLAKNWPELEARAAMGNSLAGTYYGVRSQEKIESLYYLTMAKSKLGKGDEAEILAREGIDLLKGLETFDSGALRQFQRLLAQSLTSSGKHAEAKQALEAILNSATISNAPRGRELASILEDIAMAAANLDQLTQARQRIDQALTVLAVVPEVNDFELAKLEFLKATILERKGLFSQAEDSCRRVLKLFGAENDPRQKELVEVHARLGLILEQLGRREEALAQIKKARSVLVNTMGPSHPWKSQMDEHIQRLSVE